MYTLLVYMYIGIFTLENSLSFSSKVEDPALPPLEDTLEKFQARAPMFIAVFRRAPDGSDSGAHDWRNKYVAKWMKLRYNVKLQKPTSPHNSSVGFYFR